MTSPPLAVGTATEGTPRGFVQTPASPGKVRPSSSGLPLPLCWFSGRRARCAGGRGCSPGRPQRPAHLSPCWSPGELGRRGGGAGTGGVRRRNLWPRSAGPRALFSVSSSTMEVLLRLRERLQSALRRERGAWPRRFPGFDLRRRARRWGAGRARGRRPVRRDNAEGAPPSLRWAGRPPSR